MLNFESLVTLPNVCQEFFKTYHRDIPIILFGAGGGCDNALKMFKTNGIIPAAICDNNCKKWGDSLGCIPIISLEEAISNYEDFNVYVSAPNNAHEIIPVLRLKIGEERIYFFDSDTRIDIQNYKRFLSENKECINSLFHNFKDNASKQALVNMLKGWVSSDYKYFEDIYSAPQYFPNDIFKLSEFETFADIGAFTGDSIEEFIKCTNGQYKKIIALEPNVACKNNLERLKSNYHNIEVIYKGAFNKSEKLVFDSSGISSAAHFCAEHDDNNIEQKFVEVQKIDELIKEKITYLKMDIEGLELQALQGAQNLIKKYRPKLAICVYHKINDIIEIPKFIMNLNMDYKLYLRHHSWYTGETVLYAI